MQLEARARPVTTSCVVRVRVQQPKYSCSSSEVLGDREEALRSLCSPLLAGGPRPYTYWPQARLSYPLHRHGIIRIHFGDTMPEIAPALKTCLPHRRPPRCGPAPQTSRYSPVRHPFTQNTRRTRGRQKARTAEVVATIRGLEKLGKNAEYKNQVDERKSR